MNPKRRKTRDKTINDEQIISKTYDCWCIKYKIPKSHICRLSLNIKRKKCLDMCENLRIPKELNFTCHQRNPSKNHNVIPTRMTKIKKKLTRSWQECVATTYASWVHKLMQPLLKTVWQYLQKLSLCIPYDQAIPLLDIHSTEVHTARLLRAGL